MVRKQGVRQEVLSSIPIERNICLASCSNRDNMGLGIGITSIFYSSVSKWSFIRVRLFCFGAAVETTFQYTKLFDCNSSDFPMMYFGIPIHYRKLLNCNTPGHDPWNATNGTTLLLEYIRDISILSRLWLYPYPTRSVGDAPCPLSHVPLYIQPQGSG